MAGGLARTSENKFNLAFWRALGQGYLEQLREPARVLFAIGKSHFGGNSGSGIVHAAPIREFEIYYLNCRLVGLFHTDIIVGTFISARSFLDRRKTGA